MSRALAPALAMAVLALLLATPHVDTQAQGGIDVRIRWVTYINPTGGTGVAYGVCAFGDYIAVVGTTVYKSYVALLRKSDGVVVKEWTGGEWEVFRNCISVGGKLYAIGSTSANNSYGVIYVFDENLNVLAKVRSESSSEYYSLAYDGKALYIGGWAGWKGWVWLVEKRALDGNLSLVSSKKIHFGPWIEGRIYDIGVEPSTGRIWAVGFYRDTSDKIHSLIVIFDGELRELRVIDYPMGSEGYLGWLFGIAFDGRYAYISGSDGVAKFSADGELVAVNRDGKARVKIVYGYGYLYTFREDYIRGYDRHVLYIHDTDLNIVKVYVLSWDVNARSLFYIGKPVIEGNNIYVAGYDHPLRIGGPRVVVYSLSIEGVTEDATATATTTTPVATATTVTITIPITQTTTVTVISTAIVVKTEVVTIGIPTTATIYITVPTTITVSEGAPAQLIAAGLATIGIALAVAFLLLRRR